MLFWTKNMAQNWKKERYLCPNPFLVLTMATLDMLFIEESSPREPGRRDKVLFTYDRSLASLPGRGFRRHLRSAEAFTILIHAKRYRVFARDMLSSFGEWLSLALLRQGEMLTCYLDPENIFWDDKKYMYAVEGQLKHAGERTCEIKGLYSKKWLYPWDLPDDVSEIIYSLPANRISKSMRFGSYRSRIFVPPDGIVWPCRRYNFMDKWGDEDCILGASRGSAMIR